MDTMTTLELATRYHYVYCSIRSAMHLVCKLWRWELDVSTHNDVCELFAVSEWYWHSLGTRPLAVGHSRFSVFLYMGGVRFHSVWAHNQFSTHGCLYTAQHTHSAQGSVHWHSFFAINQPWIQYWSSQPYRNILMNFAFWGVFSTESGFVSHKTHNMHSAQGGMCSITLFFAVNQPWIQYLNLSALPQHPNEFRILSGITHTALKVTLCLC